MTGRRLYDHYCDAARTASASAWEAPHSVLAHEAHRPMAWPFLSNRDRRVWNELARCVTPKKRPA